MDTECQQLLLEATVPQQNAAAQQQQQAHMNATAQVTIAQQRSGQVATTARKCNSPTVPQPKPKPIAN